MPRLLSLFDGTGSICKNFREAGWEIQSLDIDGRFGATLIQDILLWDFQNEPVPDIIFSGTPCTEYSQAKTRGYRNFALADRLVEKQWDIIQHFLNKNPLLLYFIENPASSLLWKRKCAEPFAHKTVVLDYCSYMAPYRKRTKIATNSSYLPRDLCNPKSCLACPDKKTHSYTAQRGPTKNKDFKNDRFSMDQLHAYPEVLCLEIFEFCQNSLWELL